MKKIWGMYRLKYASCMSVISLLNEYVNNLAFILYEIRNSNFLALQYFIVYVWHISYYEFSASLKGDGGSYFIIAGRDCSLKKCI